MKHNLRSNSMEDEMGEALVSADLYRGYKCINSLS